MDNGLNFSSDVADIVKAVFDQFGDSLFVTDLYGDETTREESIEFAEKVGKPDSIRIRVDKGTISEWLDSKELHALAEEKGYFMNSHDDNDRVYMEPKWPILANDEVREKCSNKMWHVTSKDSARKILKEGFKLTDGASERSLYKRSYCRPKSFFFALYTDVVETRDDTIQFLGEAYDIFLDNSREFAILEIDLSKCGDILLYEDTELNELKPWSIPVYVDKTLPIDAATLFYETE